MKSKRVRVMKIGVMAPGDMRARSIAIAKGEYKPKSGEPKVWFPSLASAAQLLSDENRAMLRAIAEAQPQSIAEAAEVVKRSPGNLSRTLSKMERYGIVRLIRSDQERPGRKPVKPVVQATDFEISTFSPGHITAAQSKNKHETVSHC